MDDCDAWCRKATWISILPVPAVQLVQGLTYAVLVRPVGSDVKERVVGCHSPSGFTRYVALPPDSVTWKNICQCIGILESTINHRYPGLAGGGF